MLCEVGEKSIPNLLQAFVESWVLDPALLNYVDPSSRESFFYRLVKSDQRVALLLAQRRIITPDVMKALQGTLYLRCNTVSVYIQLMSISGY